jgi:hypothetical protein
MVKKYLSKFVLEVLPSVFATVVGAYIVAHYINPKSEGPKAAVVATAPATEAKDAADTTGTVEDKAADTTPAESKSADLKAEPKIESKSADTKSSEPKSSEPKSADAKPADAEPAKVEPAKVETAKAKVAKPEEKKNAIELARAAIERLRGSTVDTPTPPAQQPARAPSETARAEEGARVAVQAPSQRAPAAAPALTTGVAAQPGAAVTAAPPPLPPPVIVASPYGRHSVGPEATPAAIAPAEQGVDQANANRPTPPADIPTPPADIPFQRGYDLQAQAAPVEHVSIADHVLSTTKSFFRALTPNSQPN